MKRHASPGLAVMALAAAVVLNLPSRGAEPKPAGYKPVHEVFSKHCLDCHSAQEPEAKLVLESYEALLKGGESGPAIVAGKAGDSLLVKMVEGKIERDGKPRVMPPGKRAKLSGTEIATLRAWIDAGAPPPAAGELGVAELSVPQIRLKVAPRKPIQSLAHASGPRLIGLGRYAEVELVQAQNRAAVRTITGLSGSINALAFSSDGAFLFAGGGEPGLSGEVRQLKVDDGSSVRTFAGHRDAVYSLALSPDGKILASGSYDQKIKLWDTESGTELRTLSGHNGAVFDLAFRADGRLLASASADRTVKLWDVATGERRDTLSQPLKEVNAVVFSADGKRLFAAGGDNRIRMWEISEKALETTNPLLEARFAHEGAILRLALSPDGNSLLSSASDQTVKVWDAATVKERLALPPQPDWPSAIGFATGGKVVVVGRLDGSWELYDANSGAIVPPPKPELVRAEPRGVQRGSTVQVKLVGANLAGLKEVKFADARIKAELATDAGTEQGMAWISVTTPADLKRGSYELFVRNAQGESGRIKLHVDNLPQEFVPSERKPNVTTLDTLPVSVWATHAAPGDAEEYLVRAKAGESLVFDVSARSLGSKADVVLTLSDEEGKVLASSNNFDRTGDPLLFYTFPADGQYRLRVNELVLAGSPDHFYRLSAGGFPYVTACYPMSVRAGEATEVELVGYNLPAEHRMTVRPERAGDWELPLDTERYRARRDFKLIVSNGTELVEHEPNNATGEAMVVTPPCAIAGRFFNASGSSDADLYRFSARAGQSWMIETTAGQRGSPADTRLEVLHADGKPVQRLLLQAVRDSSVTFRGIDSDTTDCRVVNWEEMDLNQYLYLQGEVVKLFRAPQGPDSGFLFYSSNGRRRCYFDTSPAAHAVDEPCYIVEPRPPGAKLVANGLPVFPLTYSNDDDGERKLGADSRLHFTAPADGDYLVRVTDTRGFHGDRFVYRLALRPPQPDFAVRLRGSDLTVSPGSGQPFTIDAERTDDFEGPITVEFGHLPSGFTVSSPLVIEAGHSEARGMISLAPGAPTAPSADWDKVEVTAAATVAGQSFVKAVNNFGQVKVGEAPKLYVALDPEPLAKTNLAVVTTNAPAKPLELTIAPGQTIPAGLRVRRNGHDDLVTFTVENLPHGVIVDNIGLNGVLIPKDQNEREIFITAAKWVGDMDRLCYAVENQAGRQTSAPVLLHVRRNSGLQAAK